MFFRRKRSACRGRRRVVAAQSRLNARGCWHAVCRAVSGRRTMPAAALRHPGRSASAAGPALVYRQPERGAIIMSIGTILLIILILALVGALPTWGYSSGWGYGPSGIAGVVVIILIILLLTGRL